MVGYPSLEAERAAHTRSDGVLYGIRPHRPMTTDEAEVARRLAFDQLAELRGRLGAMTEEERLEWLRS